MKYLDPRYIRRLNSKVYDERKRFVDRNCPSLTETEKTVCIAYYYFSIPICRIARIYKIRRAPLHEIIRQMKTRATRVTIISPAEAEWQKQSEWV